MPKMIITAHANKQLTQRQLWPALNDIKNIVAHPNAPRYFGVSSDGRPNERIEKDGIVLVVASNRKRTAFILLTAYSTNYNEVGARACARISQISRSLKPLVKV